MEKHFLFYYKQVNKLEKTIKDVTIKTHKRKLNNFRSKKSENVF